MPKISITPYLIIYITLTIISFWTAFHFWWLDPYTAETLSPEFLALLGAAGLYWLGILHLSVLLVRKLIVKNDRLGYVNPFTFIGWDYAEKLGKEKFAKAKKIFSFIAFGIFIVSIAIFIGAMKIYKQSALKNGILKTVIIEGIDKTPKQIPYARFEFEYKEELYQTHLPQNNLQVGDSVEIVISNNNPKIVEYK